MTECAVVGFGAERIAAAYTLDPAVRAATTAALLLSCLFFVADGLQVVAAQSLRARGVPLRMPAPRIPTASPAHARKRPTSAEPKRRAHTPCPQNTAQGIGFVFWISVTALRLRTP